MSDSSGVEVFISAAVCEEIEKNRKNKKKRVRANDMFVSRCIEGEFLTLLQRLRKDPVKHGQHCFSYQVQLSSVFTPLM
jgi:hypothetical protein